MIDCSWIPELVFYNDYNNWQEYEELIYSVFKKDFILSQPYLHNLIVKVRHHPKEYNKEEAFFHVTCQDYLKDNKRLPDMRRCERIKWVRKFIENLNCECICINCNGIKIWNKPYKNTYRTHILLEEEKYMVVVEKRENYCLLITAFYFDKGHMLDKKLKEFKQYK